MSAEEQSPIRPNKPPGVPSSNAFWWYLLLTFLVLWLWQDMAYVATVHTIPYSQFKRHVADREVTQCEIKETEIVGKIAPKSKSTDSETASSNKPQSSTDKASSPKTPPETKPTLSKPIGKAASSTEKPKGSPDEQFLFRTVRVEDPDLVAQLSAAGVKFTGVRPGFLSQFLLYWILPIGVMLLVWVLLSKGFRAAGESVMNFGTSRARLVPDTDMQVRFDDVAGCDEAKFELQEVVEFLKSPDRYRLLGARIPKGVLLVGLPGTGKTLLSRAVAGEAHVPFFSLSGSDFVEMFVGVGASRVRDLFAQAKKRAPCIIFIDELDAIGRERGVHVGAVNDEREQTLNQLLVEMDGFEANVGVILLAATNRPEVLDRALLRPGRFDRQVVIDPPDLAGREAILRVHSRDKPLADDVDLRRIAQETPGFSGADLANAINEAALLAARRRSPSISIHDLEDAVEKVVAGPERKSRRLNDEARRRVAYHEVGHAVVAAFCPHADPVHKISIIPRGRAALGYTLQLPTDDHFLLTRSELFDQIVGLLGGRASEEIVFGEVTTGAENDLEKATTLARQMVCLFGMSEAVGLTHCGRRPSAFLPAFDSESKLDCSDDTARTVDQEVRNLLDSAYGQAKRILSENRESLDRIADELVHCETLDAATFHNLLNRQPKQLASTS